MAGGAGSGFAQAKVCVEAGSDEVGPYLYNAHNVYYVILWMYLGLLGWQGVITRYGVLFPVPHSYFIY